MLGTGNSFSRQTPGARYFISVTDPEGAARVAAVLGELLEAGDLTLAFAPGGVLGRQRLDQAADAVADLQREVGGGGAGEGADVLRRDPLRLGQQLRVLGLAHSLPPILASSASLLTSACWFTSIASWSPITHTWL